ncbi:MAG: hypothetical protein KDD25_06465, partial [Bdellovibrionales bacterium]|nr:hypothetical protein [Bdellovibrionales bacterium]
GQATGGSGGFVMDYGCFMDQANSADIVWFEHGYWEQGEVWVAESGVNTSLDSQGRLVSTSGWTHIPPHANVASCKKTQTIQRGSEEDCNGGNGGKLPLEIPGSNGNRRFRYIHVFSDGSPAGNPEGDARHDLKCLEVYGNGGRAWTCN